MVVAKQKALTHLRKVLVYLFVVFLAHIFLGGLALLIFEPEIIKKVTGAALAGGAFVIGNKVWAKYGR